MCVQCVCASVCVCSYVSVGVCAPWCTGGGQRKSSGLLLSLLCGQARWPAFSGDSLISASHLTMGRLGVQKLHAAAASRGLWRSVLHLHVLQQMLYLLGHSPPASCPSTAGFILLCFETGSHNAAPAGLELVKICLPLSPEFWN